MTYFDILHVGAQNEVHTSTAVFYKDVVEVFSKI